MSERSALAARVRALAESADAAIAALPGVAATERQSFRVGKKVFVRCELGEHGVIYGFKLAPDDAGRALRSKALRSMRFGGMGAKGWVELELRRKAELATLLRWVACSRTLYP